MSPSYNRQYDDRIPTAEQLGYEDSQLLFGFLGNGTVMVETGRLKEWIHYSGDVINLPDYR